MDRVHPELTAKMVVDGLVPSAPALSPDGRWIVYVLATVGQVGEHASSQLWAAATDQSVEPRRLAVAEGLVSAPSWRDDSETLCFLSDHSSRGKPQLCSIRLHDGLAQQLTRWASGVQGYRLLTDQVSVAFWAPDEPTDLERHRSAVRDDAQVRGRARPDRLRILDLEMGGIRTPPLFGDRHVVDAVQRPDGGPLAVLTWSSPDPDPGLLQPALHLCDLPTNEVSAVAELPADAESPVWWRGEDWHLAYLALTPPGLQAGTAVFDVAVPDSTFAGKHQNLTEGMAACPAELVQVDDAAPFVLVADGLETAVHRITPDTLRLTELCRLSGQAAQLSVDRVGATTAAVVSGPGEPHNVYAGPTGKPLVRVTETRPELRGVRWGEQNRLRYRAADGLELDGLVVLPPGRSYDDGPFPLVTIVHGGPYGRHADGFMLHWAPSGQWLAHAGYAVFLPNPRGGKGHGHEFAASVAGAVGQQEWTDILTGVDMLVDQGIAEPGRLGIAGWSHGGFMAAWAIGQTDRFAAALMGAGISDWGMLAATGEWGMFEAALGGSVGWEGTGPHRHDRLSPISYTSSIRTPVLIVHGAEDTNVPLSQAEYFHRALCRFGAEHEFVVYPRENHSFRESSHQIDLLRRTRAWFDRWLGQPRTEPRRAAAMSGGVSVESSRSLNQHADSE